REVVKVEITGNDLMKYDKSELKVPAGTRVELTLKHSGQMRWDAMGHNVVILKPDTDVAAFCQRAVGAKKNDYIPSDEFDEIIAYTAMIGGGETSTALFDAPEKGTYDFVCSFPGHYAFMKGKFIVE
ncbi:MAG: azurin, partial [Bacteroidota bacterium]